jgi:glyoxalase family protein
MSEIAGIHHVTCIAGDPQENVDFYVGVMGMRLVKRTVNQDLPGTYHLFYADDDGSPGTDLTFFPWPHSKPRREGMGIGSEIALAIPMGSLDYWSERLTTASVMLGPIEHRRGERALPFTDPHGLALALVESGDARTFAPWKESPVPAQHQVRGLHTVRVVERDLELTGTFLIRVLGFSAMGEERGWHRFGVGRGSSGTYLEIEEQADAKRGAWGIGSMHHVAWRVADDASELAVRERVLAANRRPTQVIDRFWFKSVYFLEPGGVLFEIATDGPGFTRDEEPGSLGEHLVLPPWLEPRRPEIIASLPELHAPTR